MRLTLASRHWWILFILWLGATTWASATPGNRIPPLPFPQADKIAHLLIYAAGGFLLTRALMTSRNFRPAVLIGVSFVAMVALGIGDEIHQTFTPGRRGSDRGDLLADLLGASLGIALSFWRHAPLPCPTHPGTPRPDRAA